jgi:hypothetical protein
VLSARRAVVAAALASLALAVPASADLGSLKAACGERDAADGDTSNGVALPYVFCDDGLPPVGGTQPNEGAVSAIPVPQRYEGWAGLPPKVAPDAGSGADANGDVALDADLTLPDPRRFPPPERGYPLVVFMHGCCGGDKRGWEADRIDAGGEKWHYSNAWFAARGYAVLTYTSRGFVNADERGSTGWTELDSRRYEINDFQHLAGQLADDPDLHVDGERIVVTAGSYGGGFAWLAMTDPTWKSPGGEDMRVVAVAPKYGWTDLVYSLVPNGSHMRDALPAFDGSGSASPFGVPKRSIVAGLYASGKTGIPPGTSSHATFPPKIDDAIVCLQSTDPFESNPACGSTLETTLPEFLDDRSAYYQNEFFERVRGGLRVPVYSAGAFTDPLFTMVEHRRMAVRLHETAGGRYPIQEHYGDYQHFVQNKAKEWGDVCADGETRRVCTLADQGGDPTASPRGRVRVGITTRLNRFLDHYARPQANPRAPLPPFDVTASLQVCPQNRPEGIPADEPGERFTARTFEQLATGSARFEIPGEQQTTNDASPNPHAASSDPVANQLANGGRCPVETEPGGPGVATYDTPMLDEDLTMIGRTRVIVPHTGSGSGIQLVARLYDVLPDGSAVMVDRGHRAGVAPSETTVIDLAGNGWRFAKGHRIRVELTQDDDPHLKASTQPSSLTLAGATLEIPVRTAGPAARLDAPRLASDVSQSRLFGLRVAPASEDEAGTAGFELAVRGAQRSGYRRFGGELESGPMRFRGLLGRTYRLRARAVDARGVPGPWAYATTVVPLDDFRGTRGVRYRGSWTRPRVRGAYEQRVSRSARRGDSMTLRFRGRRVWLVGRTTRRGGRALVTLDGRRRVVSFRSRTTRVRRVLLELPVRGRGVHTLRVVSRGGGRVELDAIGILDRRP